MLGIVQPRVASRNPGHHRRLTAVEARPSLVAVDVVDGERRDLRRRHRSSQSAAPDSASDTERGTIRAHIMTKLTFLGAARTVTGSKYLVETGGHKILIDCGLFQGLKELRLRNWEQLPVDPSDLS